MILFILKKIGLVLLAATGILLLYILCMWLLSLVPANEDFRQSETDFVEIFVMSNGVHTDLVLPYRTEERDWSLFFGAEADAKKVQPEFIAAGWGDKGFYLETPTWAELKFSTAFNALFFMSESAMHISFIRKPACDEACISLKISPAQYKILSEYVEKSFLIKNSRISCITGASYGKYDVFYDAVGTYSFYYTCNSWANEGLKAAGIKAALWTLSDKPILKHLSK